MKYGYRRDDIASFHAATYFCKMLFAFHKSVKCRNEMNLYDYMHLNCPTLSSSTWIICFLLVSGGTLENVKVQVMRLLKTLPQIIYLSYSNNLHITKVP